ncbi:MAG TPA: gephyrin-like molybdotransferase Glp, partial [Vicinamibacterales bacterium]|nr:gephyrin-like molybdotransferase Glp [Vicinamibacterales bacterium]
MRPIRRTISFDEALALVVDAVSPIARTERVALPDANGRVLAETIAAAADVPAFDRAAMDGFAVRAEDTAGATGDAPISLRCVDTIYTGRAPTRILRTGECAEIATGAPLPPGADAVVMVEDTDRADGSAQRPLVQIMKSVQPRQNVGPRGGDIRQGETVLTAGDLLTPSRVGACVAAGRADAEVYARPVVAIVSTGAEVVAPGQPLGPAQVHDVNGTTLSAVVAMHGGVPRAQPSVGDDLPAIQSMLADAIRTADIMVFSGGSSVGEKDLVLDALREAGEVLFHGIAVKPGKPTALARVGSTPVLAMPGNPTSCLSNAYLLLVPMLRKMARLPAHTPRAVTLPLAKRIVSTAGRHQFYTVKVVDGGVVPAFKSSGDITSMSHADGYIEVPAQTEIVEAGETVD